MRKSLVVKVLHLIEPGSPGGGACTLRLLAGLLARLPAVTQDVLLIGTRAHSDLARRCGVPVLGAVCPPARRPSLCRRPLARTLRDLEAARGPYDVIHAWSPGAARLLALAAPRRPRIATCTVGPAGALAAFLLASALERDPMPLLVPGAVTADEYRAAGVPNVLLLVMPPGIDFDAPAAGDDRAALRRRWGAEDDTLVVGLLSEPAGWGDGRWAAEVVARVAVSGRSIRLVTHAGAARRADAERWARRIGRRDVITSDHEIAEPWRVLAGLDAVMHAAGPINATGPRERVSFSALITGVGRWRRPTPGLLPILWAMGRGLPVVAESTDAATQVVSDGETGVLFPPGLINPAAAAIMRLADDRALGRRLGARAQAAVRERFDADVYGATLAGVYDRILAGGPWFGCRMGERRIGTSPGT